MNLRKILNSFIILKKKKRTEGFVQITLIFLSHILIKKYEDSRIICSKIKRRMKFSFEFMLCFVRIHFSNFAFGNRSVLIIHYITDSQSGALKKTGEKFLPEIDESNASSLN